jgi:hypothetical protein
MSLSDVLKRAAEQAGTKRTTPEPVVSKDPVRERRVLGGKPAFEEPILEPEAVQPIITPVAEPDTTTTVTRALQTPELQDIQQQQDELFQRRRQAAEEAAQLEAVSAQEQSQIQEDLAGQVQEIGLERDQATALMDQEIRDGEAKTDELRAQYESMQPRSFWQKADTQDKILMSLAVILGGIGQGLSGAKVNAAAQAMDRTIERDLQLQRVALNKQLRAIEASRLSTADKRLRRRDAVADFAAREQAAITHASRLIEAVKTRTKGATHQAALTEFLGELEAAQLEKRFEAAERIAGTVSTQVVDKAKPTKVIYDSFKDASQSLALEGLSETQRDNAAKVIENEPRVQRMEEFEQTLTKDEWARLQSSVKEFQAMLSEAEIPVAGDAARLARIRFGETGAEIFERFLPGKGAAYFRDLFSLSNEIARIRSGAAIASSEYYAEAIKFGPSSVPSKSDMKVMWGSRRNLLEGLRMRSGVPARLFYEEVN